MTAAYETSHAPGTALGVHRHAEGYAALVLEGGYEELTAEGRFACGPGTLVIHPDWHAHGDAFGTGGATVLNLPAPLSDGFRVVSLSDAAAFERLARCRPDAAVHAAMEEADAALPLAPAHWLVRLTALLARQDNRPVEVLAQECGVSPEHAARRCKAWFGLGPVQLRKERRLQTAITLLREGASPAEAAAASGFSDQPHLTRLLKRATGLTPARLSSRLRCD